MKPSRPLSYSSLKAFAKSPNHYLSYIDGKSKPSPAMELGTAIHCAVLEPDRFHETYDLSPHRKNTKVFREMAAQRPETTFLNPSDWQTVKNVREAVVMQDHHHLISMADRFEVEVTGDIRGLPFRGFIDAMGVSNIVDLKTCRDASLKEFERSAWNFDYYLQAAVYCELTGLRDFWIVAAETQEPYNVVSYYISDAYLKRGRQKLFELIERFKAWDGEPQGYIHKKLYFTFDAPRWA